MLKRIYLLFFFSFVTLTSDATHIVGGELYYTYLGNNQYRIQLTVYRDCFYGVPPFDQPALVGVWNANNNFLFSVNLFPNDSATIPPIINSPCFIPPTNVCYRVCNYFTTITLGPTAGGYQLAYQRCCRNQTILNIIDPLDVGAAFYCYIPGTGAFPNNSNPQFNELPPPFICLGYSFEFDHSATDAEGDSLVYEICTPYDGASLAAPVLNEFPPVTGNPPQPNAASVQNYPPPYSSVLYQPPFNMSNLLGGIPLTINPQTGLLTATPSNNGQFV